MQAYNFIPKAIETEVLHVKWLFFFLLEIC